MDNIINETNTRLQAIIDDLTTVKEEYEKMLNNTNKEIDEQLAKVKQYKEEFYVSKQKIEKMNSDIEGFENDYKNLVERFKDDELANILIAANKEISTKIEERRKKITRDKISMNELVELAEECKNKLVKLNTAKKVYELQLAKVLDSHEFYSKSLSQIINYSIEHPSDLSSCFYEEGTITSYQEKENNNKFVDIGSEETEDVLYEEDDDEEIELDENDTIEEDIEEDFEENELPEDKIELEETEDIDEDDQVEEDEEFEYDDIDEKTLEQDLDLNNEDEIDLNDDDENINEDIETNESEDEINLDDIPTSLYDLNDSLDLENFLGLDDELKEDEK